MAETASRLTLVPRLHSTAFCLLAERDADVVYSPDRQHIVIGAVFDRTSDSRPIREINGGQPDFVMQELLEHHWGAYIAVLRDGGGNCINILRDPSGLLPCYYRKNGECILISSRPDLLFPGRIGPAQIDYQFLHASLAYTDIISSRTALVALEELMPGCSLLMENGIISQELCWRPSVYTGDRPKRSFAQNAEALRLTIDDCVKAWTKVFPRAMLTLSGGLDSSVVASSLSRAKTSSLLCMTAFASDDAGDERLYARAMAQEIEAELVEVLHEASLIDVSSLHPTLLARPSRRLSGEALEQNLDALSNQSKSDAIFDGFGGDNIFCLLRSGAPLADRWVQEGMTPALLRTLRDIADMTEASWIEILQSAWHAHRAPSVGHTQLADCSFLMPSGSQALPDVHPWLNDMATASTAKFRHVRMITRTHEHLDRPLNASGCARISPLLSQPVIEKCLEIPTWQWCTGGRDRAVVRAGFSGCIPSMILARSAKGTPSSHYAAVLECHTDPLQALLLDGLLAKNDVIDLRAVENAFGDHNILRDGKFLRLLALADAERWARSWNAAFQIST